MKYEWPQRRWNEAPPIGTLLRLQYGTSIPTSIEEAAQRVTSVYPVEYEEAILVFQENMKDAS
jgi:hypothetical protein